MLRGRNEQCRLIDALIAEAGSGRSRVDGAAGEPGIGKSALMQYAAKQARTFTWPAPTGSSRKWNCPTPRSINCADRCSITSTAFQSHQAAALRIAFGLRATPPSPRLFRMPVLEPSVVESVVRSGREPAASLPD